MTSRRLLFPVAIALILFSCHSTAVADRHFEANGRVRAARPAPAPAQWNHEWARGAVVYELFVRSFSDSDGDGIGDLKGLIAKLDYLNDGDPATTTDLGIDAIWLMPVFQSPSYHGYDTVDYETIEKDYGSNADFRRLLDEAHKRGIRVILDLVMNHTSSQHPWFLDSASSPTSARRDWYIWSATNPGWSQPWGGDPSWHLLNGEYYYGVFWSGMPDLNYRSPEVKAEMFRIARSWLAQGVDGFRLDATRYLVESGPGAGQADIPETHQLLKEFAADVRRARPEAILVAENTTDTGTLAQYYGSTVTIRGGDEMPMNFNFPLAAAIVDGVKSGNATGITSTLREVIRVYPGGVIDAPFLTNHDQTRLATLVGNNGGKLRNAAAILLTLPGAPFV
jgi:alpha-amylase